MKFTDLLTTYWSQVTLVLLGIGYFIKLGFSNKSKKIEINHSLFQQNRIETINRFFESYSESVNMWKEISLERIFPDDYYSKNKYTITDMDNMTRPILNQLDINLLQLKVYFEEKYYKHFENIVNNNKLLYKNVLDLYFNTDGIKSTTTKMNKFHTYKETTFKKNNDIISSLTIEIKNLF